MNCRWRGTAVVLFVMILPTVLPPSAARASPSQHVEIGSFGRDGGECMGSEDVVDRFLRAVERGELVIFGQTLTRAQVRPVRVDHAYELESGARTVSVHAQLISAIPLPADDAMVVRSVEAVMGRVGRIMETRAHVTFR